MLNNPEDLTTSSPEALYQREREIRRQKRADFWPVPLWPWGLHPEAESELSGSDYLNLSQNKIVEKLESSLMLASDNGWLREGTNLEDLNSDQDLAALFNNLANFMHKYLLDAQIMRIQRNDRSKQTKEIYNDPTVKFGNEGLASPGELLEILEKYQSIGSLEVAKLSHPLSYDATKPMDEYVEGILKSGDFQPAKDKKPVYKRIIGDLDIKDPRSIDDSVPAVIVEVKRLVASKQTENDKIYVANRLRLIARGDEAAAGLDAQLQCSVIDFDRFPELAAKIDESLPYLSDKNLDLRWLQPLTSSYYAYYKNAPRMTLETGVERGDAIQRWQPE